ncbi:hypothetical protein HDU78_002587 [Chytriomyces hyalinus]|nr:hypothetical protein HDU78_002587 [Chytriomyces hyalinus]
MNDIQRPPSPSVQQQRPSKNDIFHWHSLKSRYAPRSCPPFENLLLFFGIMQHSLPALDNEAAAANAQFQEMLDARKQSVPGTPFVFATPLMQMHSVNDAPQQGNDFNPAFDAMQQQTDYYRRMSLPAHLMNGQIPDLVNYSAGLQSNLMNSFSPYIFQGQFEQTASPMVSSMTLESIGIFDPSQNLYNYETAPRAPTPFFDMSASLGTTPMQSPIIHHQTIPTQAEMSHAPESDLSSPPQSPKNGSRRSSSDMGKKSRFKATEAELPILSAVFEKNPFPSAVLRQKLADRLGLESKQIQFWFQNRRATLKINGIHVVKPKKTNTPSASQKPKPALAPLTAGNNYFYVEADAGQPLDYQHQQQQQQL